MPQGQIMILSRTGTTNNRLKVNLEDLSKPWTGSLRRCIGRSSPPRSHMIIIRLSMKSGGDWNRIRMSKNQGQCKSQAWSNSRSNIPSSIKYPKARVTITQKSGQQRTSTTTPHPGINPPLETMPNNLGILFRNLELTHKGQITHNITTR